MFGKNDDSVYGNSEETILSENGDGVYKNSAVVENDGDECEFGLEYWLPPLSLELFKIIFNIIMECIMGVSGGIVPGKIVSFFIRD